MYGVQRHFDPAIQGAFGLTNFEAMLVHFAFSGFIYRVRFSISIFHGGL